MSTDQSTRLESLDALRGLAAIGVVLFHYLPYYDQLYTHQFILPAGLDNALQFGRYGVQLFFILSGFVIFMTLERTRSAGWFALARAFRLLPALWAGIILTSLSVHILGPQDRAVSLSDALLNTVLLHEYLGLPHVDGAYWSLVVEVTFYAWIGSLFYGMNQWRHLRMALWLWLAVSYAGVIWWKSLPESLEFPVKDLLFVKYAPLFISGMILYRWHRHGPLPSGEWLLLMLAILHSLVAYKAPYSFFVLGCYGTFALAVAGRLQFLASRPLLWLGSLSYTLYLVHQNIGYGIIELAYANGAHGAIGVSLALATALTLAALVHYGVEKPCLAWFRDIRLRMTRRRDVPLPDLGQASPERER
ncbi:MAG: acyltransferase [Marinobacter sp.]|nr:acyltransferase [Marinobacter sp.]